MGIFSFFRIIFGAASSIRRARAHAASLRLLPMGEFLPKWAEALSHGLEEMRPILRRPATEEEIAATEARVGGPLPAELRDFYRSSDGIRWPEGSFMSNISSLDALQPSSRFLPPLSAQLLAEWNEWGKEQEEPRGLRVFADSFSDMLTDTAERTIPFSEVDTMLSLETPQSGKGAVMVVTKNRHFAIGTVLDVENLQATRYENLRAWMASTVANHAVAFPPSR